MPLKSSQPSLYITMQVVAPFSAGPVCRTTQGSQHRTRPQKKAVGRQPGQEPGLAVSRQGGQYSSSQAFYGRLPGTGSVMTPEVLSRGPQCIAGLLGCSTVNHHDHAPYSPGFALLTICMQLFMQNACVHDMPSGLPLQAEPKYSSVK